MQKACALSLFNGWIIITIPAPTHADDHAVDHLRIGIADILGANVKMVEDLCLVLPLLILTLPFRECTGFICLSAKLAEDQFTE